jgi:hypothetical protein
METPHNLGRQEAARRLKQKFGHVRDKYGASVNNLQEKWDDHTFSFDFSTMGMAVSGTIEVGDNHVKLDAELPFMAMIFKGAIQQRIGEELGDLLA